MKSIEIYKYLSEMIPSELSCDWDNDGLMCAAGIDNEVKGILVTLDATAEAIKYAADNDYNVIVTHHPLIFHPVKSLTSQKLLTLVKNDITVMSFHTRLDKVEGGVNDVLALKLNLTGVEKRGELLRIGNLPFDMILKDFAVYVKNALDVEFVRYSGRGTVVRRVAVVSGDGKDEYAEALASGADTYVTGDISYNIMADAADEGLNIVAAGHYATENPICDTLAKILRIKFNDIRADVYDCIPVREG